MTFHIRDLVRFFKGFGAATDGQVLAYNATTQRPEWQDATGPQFIQGEGDPATYSPGGFDIEITGIATGGTYTIVINGVETDPIAYDHSNLSSIVTDALGADVAVEVDLSAAPFASLYLAPVNGYGTLTIAMGTSSLTGSGSPEATGTYYDWTDALQSSLAISSQYVNTLNGEVWLMSKDTNNQPYAVRKTWRQITGF